MGTLSPTSPKLAKVEVMKHIILTATNPRGLEKKITKSIGEGFVPVGSHQVVTIYSQNKFSGTKHMATQHELEYSQTMVLNPPKKSRYETIEDETKKQIESLDK